MDRFLSKAKRVDNGEWVVGYYAKELRYNFFSGEERLVDVIYSRESNGEWDNMYTREIDPSTLCQFARKIKDTQIFEGDYFWHMVEEGLVGVVIWNTEELKWDVKIVPNIKANQCVPDFSNCIEWWELWEYDEIEVIGNIHNKEVEQ